MTTHFTYYPTKGVSINGVIINWGDNRPQVRSLLKDRHLASDNVINLNEYGGGQILQKRDVYEDLFAPGDYFFLNYDESETLIEIELHDGIELTIEQVRISFNSDFSKVVSQLKMLSPEKELSAGEYLFEDLRLTISDSENTGGDGHNVAYIYLAQNIEHLND